MPTRELALQTAAVLKTLAKYMDPINVVVTTGGTDLKEDIIRLMKAVHIIVATPGRLLDLCEKKVANLGKCGLFVMVPELPAAGLLFACLLCLLVCLFACLLALPSDRFGGVMGMALAVGRTRRTNCCRPSFKRTSTVCLVSRRRTVRCCCSPPLSPKPSNRSKISG